MDKLVKFFNKVLGLNSVNDGYIGLTSFEQTQIPPKSEEKPAFEQKTSFTGMLKRV